MRRFALLVMLVAACGDNYSLQIVAEQPSDENLKRLIEKTVVTVYETELDTLTCEQIEFGDVTDDLLLGAAVAQQTVHEDGRSDGKLDDIPRLGRKVIVARMYTGDDVLIAAGCAEQGDLDGDETIVVKTVVAASAAIDPFDLQDPYGKQVTVLDPLGNSLANREVRWRVFAPDGAGPASTNVKLDPNDSTIWDSAQPACTNAGGRATTRIVPPAKVEGFVTRFRVSWPAKPVELVSGFVRPGAGIKVLASPPPSNRCAIRTVGERRVVCLEGSQAHRYEVTPGANKNYLLLDRGSVAVTAAGVFSVDDQAGKEVYAFQTDGGIARLFGGATINVSCPGCMIDDARFVPKCGTNDTAQIIMHSAANAPIRAVPITGGTAAAFDLPPDLPTDVTVSINSTGCVTTINASGAENDLQVVVLDLSTTDGRTTRAMVRCGPSAFCSVPLPFPEAGVGFLQVATATKPEHQLVGTSFDVSGTELIGWVLRQAGTSFLLIDRQRITAASAPTQILVGRLDGDMEPDLIWSMRGGRSSLLQLSYAQPLPDGSRLSALLPIGAVDEILLGDLTGDGFDDLVGVSANAFTVLPQNVEGPMVPSRTMETTCAN